MIEFDSFVQTLDELVNANPHARSKGNAFKQWCKENFNINARISYVKAQQQITNRVSEQFRYFDPLVVFVCNDDVKRESIVKYILERGYAKLQCVAIIGVKIDEEGKAEYDFEQLISYKKSEFFNWASSYFSQKDDAHALKQQEGFDNEDIEDEIQIIYYGAPGTGKSFEIDAKTKNLPNKFVYRTTFHPDSDYSTFVGAYKPTMEKKAVRNLKGHIVKENGSEVYEPSIVYTFVPQAFLKAYLKAWQNPTQPVILVIEEINRGNCAQIFGDLFQLLDRQKNGYSTYPIEADTDIQKVIRDYFKEGDYQLQEDINVGDVVEKYTSNYGKTLSEDIQNGNILLLPNNLYIWATMNTSDQSLFPIDSAFKRRWDWEYVPIKYANGNWVIEIGECRYSWVSFQKIVNKKVYEINHSEDKMLGDFFVKANDQDVITEKVLINKILFYLWNDVCKDGEGDIFKKDENTDLTFSDLYGSEGTTNLIAMMKYLGVEEINTNNANGNNTTNSGTNGDSDPKYIINGVETINSARQTVKRTIIKYVEEHPAISIDELRELWNEKTGRPLLETTYIQPPSDSRSRRDEITWDNNTKSVWVWMDWSGEAIKPFIEKAKKLGITIDIVY